MGFKIESSLLDACALAILHRGDTYGYEITQEMKKSITVAESTLYPVLRRLQSEELCRTYDQPYQGRNRRYYSITEKGEAKLRDYLTQWYQYRNAIQTLLEGPGTPDETAEPEGSTKEKGKTEPKDAKENADAEETTDIKEKDEKKTGSENAELSDKKKQSGNKTQRGKKAQNKDKTKNVKKDKKEKKEGGAADE